ncbi:hypothetical protein DIS24_g10271 [Lasiodiplodia hormozganensis]|uniref:Protein SERAC1 n=1 Tax=Lasiodiplodia hormozganensis TaxID=869390 RepID=A0AA40CH16_9PEZI|nr:hypothetical protein DIS24_g10271 [Lasiodiplodia hormozganensis]
MPPFRDGATSAPLPRASELTPPPEPQPPTSAKTTNAYKTFRLSVSGLSVKPNSQRVKELVGSALRCSDEQVNVCSIATDPVVPKRIMATLEFTTIPESLSRFSKESKHKVTVDGCYLVFDDHFLGLTALTDPEDERAIDVVAVSGLNGHPFGSFKTRGGNWMWLRDGLRQDVPGSRVLTYGLNTELIDSKSSENIIDLGRQCREALFSISSATNKPLVLVGHSLGGIILREVYETPMMFL